MSFTPDEIQFLGDLNFKARAELNHTGSLAARLLALAPKLKDGTYPSWPLDQEVLNAMAANEYGRNDPRSQPILDRFALVYRTSIDWNYRLPAPAPTTTPPPPPAEGDLAALLAAAVARISKLEAQVGAAPGVPFPANATVIEGDVIFKGRVGLGGIIDDCRSPLQFVGETSLMFANNFDLSNPDASGANFGTVSLSGDGGLRNLQNGYFSRTERDAFDPDAKRWYKSTQVWPNQTRAQVNIGPDSRGDWSLSKKMPPGFPGEDHEYTQDVVFRIDEANKRAGFRLYRPGFKWEFGIDSKYGPETFWTPELYVSRG